MFGFLSASGRSNTPTFDNDPVDLQVKSLLYIYKRLKINKLGSFLDRNSLQWADGSTSLSSDLFHQKLDATYNVEAFKRLLVADEHRVLIDYAKNKFRAFCFVESLPSANMSRPGSPTKGAPMVPRELNGFPVLVDENQHVSRFFKFEVFPLKGTLGAMCDRLAYSDIYVEHKVDLDSRMKFAWDAIKFVLGSANRDDRRTITVKQKNCIIHQFLANVATHVQISRIYDEFLNRDLKSDSKTLVSPAVESPKTPIRTLKARKSTANLRPASPPRLSARRSIADLRQSPSLKSIPILRPDSSSGHSDASSVPPKQSYRTPSQIELWEKCSKAVKDKLGRERQILSASA